LREGQTPVLRYLLARAGSAGEAGELAQETLVRAYCALAAGQRPQRLIPWLLGIARRVLLEAWRAQRYERQLHERLAGVMGPEWESPWQVPWRERLERRIVVAHAVERLPMDLRAPVLLHYMGGWPLAEVASHLETTPGAVKMRLLRARRALRLDLENLLEGAVEDNAVRPSARPARGRTAGQTQPVYDEISVGMHVGGRRGATQPMGNLVLSGAGLSLDDLRLAVERLRAAGTAGGAGAPPLFGRLSMWPALDPFEHPDPAAVWSFLRGAEIGNKEFQRQSESRLVPTDGRRIGTDPDWRPLLDGMRAAGLRHVWFTFAGLEATHDDLCGRPGAFREVVMAMERCAAAGLETGANLIVSTRNVREIRALGSLVRSLRGERFVPTYVESWSTSPIYEAIRPEPEDLAGLPPSGSDVNWGYHSFWADPAAHAEGALTRAARETAPAPDAPATEPGERSLSLLVTANLELQAGTWWEPPLRPVANLRDDAPEEVRRRLVALEPVPAPPPDAELAARYGDPDGRKVYMGVTGLRRKWLASWRAEQGQAMASG
jgi:RNA polymerase sigma-70 factor (ECF subfamily)